MERLYEQNRKHKSIAEPHLARARATSHYLKKQKYKLNQQNEEQVVTDDAENVENPEDAQNQEGAE